MSVINRPYYCQDSSDQTIKIKGTNSKGCSVCVTATVTEIRVEKYPDRHPEQNIEKGYKLTDVFGAKITGHDAGEALKEWIRTLHVHRKITEIDNPEGDSLVSTAEQRCIMQEYNPDCEINVGK